MTQRRLAMLFSLALVFISSIEPLSAQQHLAIARRDRVMIVNAETRESIRTINPGRTIRGMAYRPDGKELGIGMCSPAAVVKFETLKYNQVNSAAMGNCTLANVYSPDNQSLAATYPSQPLSPMIQGVHLRIRGSGSLDRDLTLGLGQQSQTPKALAYRPGGGELAVATRTGFTVLSTVPGFPSLKKVTGITVRSLGYTTDGARLLVGTSTGFQVRNAAGKYEVIASEDGGAVVDIAVAPFGGWVALVRSTSVSMRRASDLSEASQIASDTNLRDADFASDGSLFALASPQRVRRFRTGTWEEQPPILNDSASNPINFIAFRPIFFGQRIPVLFVHGHTDGSTITWFNPGTGVSNTSFAAALAVNPQLRIDAFYLELPVHDALHPVTSIQERSITEDSRDINAMIEGGVDSNGRRQVGIINMPSYKSSGRVAIISFSQGTISSRYYINRLMTRGAGDVGAISEFVTLAAPNHGVSFGCLFLPNNDDRSSRQLCVGRKSSIGNCGSCFGIPDTFDNNTDGEGPFAKDETFMSDLNGHPVTCSNNTIATFDTEALFRRTATTDGIFYLNLFATDDEVVGDGTSIDCVGRRQPRNLATDLDNRPFNGVANVVHKNVPHHWDIICTALNTVANHVAPSTSTPCAGLTRP